MYANANFYRRFFQDKLPEPPCKSTTLAIGPRFFIDAINEKYQLFSLLNDIFGEEDANLILDLSMYMLFDRNAVFQHFPDWARRFHLYSNCTRSDSFISRFLGEKLTYSKIKLFCYKWAKLYIKDGHVYFCYDSTNVNSQARGMYIVQKGYAKDDNTLTQVNTDYVVRQDDGLPLTFMEFPGSIVDIAEAETMINFIKSINDQDDNRFKIIFVCDRGYISEKNLLSFYDAGIGFIIMIRANMVIYKQLIKEYGQKIKFNFKYHIETTDKFGMTVPVSNFIEGMTLYFHIIYDQDLAKKDYTTLNSKIKLKSKFLSTCVNRQKKFTQAEIKEHSDWHDLEVEEAWTVTVKSKNGDYKEVPAYIIKSFETNTEKINLYLNECGFYILISSEEITAEEADYRYLKRDCVEKVFRTLKSSLGMDVIGIASPDNLHGKALIWFVASILHAIIFNTTSELKKIDKKNYTMPSIIRAISAIECDKNLISGKYERRYTFDKKQKNIARKFNLTINDLDELIKTIKQKFHIYYTIGLACKKCSKRPMQK